MEVESFVGRQMYVYIVVFICDTIKLVNTSCLTYTFWILWSPNGIIISMIRKIQNKVGVCGVCIWRTRDIFLSSNKKN